jgi:hypothetical protein
VADQDWKRILINSGTGTFASITEAGICPETLPVIYNIARKFSDFRKFFTELNGNFMAASLIENKALTAGIRSKEYLTVNEITLSNWDPQIKLFLSNITISDLIREGAKISKREFERNNGIILAIDVWRKLDNIRSAALIKYGRNENQTCQTFSNFMERWKRGSRKIRNILCADRAEFIPHNILKFAENVETVINLEVSKEINRLWCKNYLSNDIRVFTFNMHNNTLPVNIILSHFAPDVGRNCTFCDIVQNPEEEPETAVYFLTVTWWNRYA